MKPLAVKDQLMKRKIEVMGIPLTQYKWKSCIAEVGEGKHWATIYSVASAEQGKGHATELLIILKEVYKDKDFGGTVALNPAMKRVYEKSGVKEYDQ